MFIKLSYYNNIFKTGKSIHEEIPVVLQESYIPSLDGFRAISILYVIIAHATKAFSGHLGVSTFFVISGFLITTLLLKEGRQNGRISLKKFYIRRALRILPVSYLYLFVLIVMAFGGYIQISANSFYSGFLFLVNTTIFEISHSEVFVGHYWSLSVEEQFYLIFPAIIALTYLRPLRYLLVLFFVFILVHTCIFIGPRYFDTIRPIQVICELFRNLSGIVIGSFFSVMYFYGAIPEKILLKKRVFLTLFCLLAAIGIQFKLIPIIPSSFSEFFIGIMILVNIHNSNDFIFKFLNCKPMVFIGALSYSLYIWQQLFTYCVPWRNSFPGADSMFLNIPLLFIVSYVSYNYFEKYFLKFKKHIK